MNTNKKKIILLNSPPRAGKDYAANYIYENFDGVLKAKFATILKLRTHALYGHAYNCMNYYEDCKDLPHEDFLGLTPRQAYINVSETYFKPVHGIDIFGKLLLNQIKDNTQSSLIVISDSGFVEEAQVLIDYYGKENIILIQIEREGCTFNNDSRSYIDLGKDICTTKIYNDGTSSFDNIIHALINNIIEFND